MRQDNGSLVSPLESVTVSLFEQSPRQIIAGERRRLEEERKVCDPPAWRLAFHHIASNGIACGRPYLSFVAAGMYVLSCAYSRWRFDHPTPAGQMTLWETLFLCSMWWLVTFSIGMSKVRMGWERSYSLHQDDGKLPYSTKFAALAILFLLVVWAIPGGWFVLFALHVLVSLVWPWSVEEARRKGLEFLAKDKLDDLELLERAYGSELAERRSRVLSRSYFKKEFLERVEEMCKKEATKLSDLDRELRSAFVDETPPQVRRRQEACKTRLDDIHRLQNALKQGKSACLETLDACHELIDVIVLHVEGGLCEDRPPVSQGTVIPSVQEQSPVDSLAILMRQFETQLADVDAKFQKTSVDNVVLREMKTETAER